MPPNLNPIEFENFKASLKGELLQSNGTFNFQLSEDFINWFVANGIFYNKVHSVVPNDLKIQCSTAGNCFQNSQLVTLQNKNVIYIEGVLRTIKSKKMVHHAFNLVKDTVIDITHLNNKEAYFDELKEESYFYFGVPIEPEFISSYPEILTTKFLDNPLLIKYFNYKTS